LQFIVCAKDEGTPRKVATATVTINVERDFNKPKFLNIPSYNKTVIETIPINSQVLQVVATDADNDGTINYEIQPDPFEYYKYFQINKLNGWITLAKDLKTDQKRLMYKVICCVINYRLQRIELRIFCI
jgi:hypothetical protein